MYVSLWDLKLPKLNVFCRLKHLFHLCVVAPNFKTVSQKGQISLKCSLNFAFPKIHFMCCPKF